MTVTINGSGTIGGISVGGLNDSIITKNEMATGGAWAPAGTVLQVVQGVSTTDTTITSTTYTDTTLSATITPTSATSKILIVVSQGFRVARDTTSVGYGLQVVRGSTVISTDGAVAIQSGEVVSAPGASTVVIGGKTALTYLDSPASTSATTYKTQARVNTTTSNASARFQIDSAPSTITLMEIAA